MDLARSYDGAQGFPHWILAGTQSKARGRQGRSWLCPAEAFAASLVMLNYNVMPHMSVNLAVFKEGYVSLPDPLAILNPLVLEGMDVLIIS